MLKNNFMQAVALIFLTAAPGCQTHQYVITESLLSAKEHRKAVVVAFGDARLISQNGREIYSHYHDRKFKFIDEPTKVDIRYFTKTSILGARRPYEITVEVRTEQKDPETKAFVDRGLDNSLSKKRLTELTNMLNQSRDNSQQFDVENPF